MTPMMEQYSEIKSANPDCLLFYRMGDFYELFFEDAIEASRALGITLTKRGKHLEEDIPMCGVPVHAADDYLQRLIRLGFRVAICEQLEDPAEAKKRGAKAVVKRGVTRLVTSGTLTEDSLLDAKQNNYLVSITSDKNCKQFAIAWADISTGEFNVTISHLASITSDISRLNPSEIIYPDNLSQQSKFIEILNIIDRPAMPLAQSCFNQGKGERALEKFFQVKTIESFGNYNTLEISACGAIIDYITITQIDQLPSLQPPRKQFEHQAMLIDAATRKNLELVETLKGEYKGSLLSIIDKTATGFGSRLLNKWLSMPLLDCQEIIERQDGIEFFFGHPNYRDTVYNSLRKCPDMARALSRITVGRSGPRDLAAIKNGIRAAQQIVTNFNDSSLDFPDIIKDDMATIASDDNGLCSILTQALNDELPLLARDGNFIRNGFNKELDEFRTLRDESRLVINQLQEKYIELSEIKGLKIKHNRVLGFFIDVTAQYGNRLLQPPLNSTFIHRQTLANNIRFTTTELIDIESKISEAADKALEIEINTFNQLLDKIIATKELIIEIANAMARIDVISSLASLAVENNYIRPIVNNGNIFSINKGRHPVVEVIIKQNQDSQFIPNDCHLYRGDKANCSQIDRKPSVWLLTGPNMAGKSTFLRQNAIIAVMAQIGSFVPAEKAEIGIIDRLFSRVGAADDLARGQSTFMVEMIETATILNQAGPKSLVILDEIGRGTATFDGLAIAWACIEHLHDKNKCLALFATHFHELTALSNILNKISNVTIKIEKWNDEVIFLHEVISGCADGSYGIQVARLAGMPPITVRRAEEIIKRLENEEQSNNLQNIVNDLPLFTIIDELPNEESQIRDSHVEYFGLIDKITEIIPDELTPREALDLIYDLKKMAQ